MKEEKSSEIYRFEEGLQGTTWVFKLTFRLILSKIEVVNILYIHFFIYWPRTYIFNVKYPDLELTLGLDWCVPNLKKKALVHNAGNPSQKAEDADLLEGLSVLIAHNLNIRTLY